MTKIEEMAQLFGHVVLFTPVSYCEYNAIELIWARLKGYLAVKNFDFTMEGVLRILKKGARKRCKRAYWKKVDAHVQKVEQEDRNSLGLEDALEEEGDFVIDMDELSSDDEADDDAPQPNGSEEALTCDIPPAELRAIVEMLANMPNERRRR